MVVRSKSLLIAQLNYTGAYTAHAEICPPHARSDYRMAAVNSTDNKVNRVQKKVIKQHLTERAHVKELNQINL
jgi:hypothetical protein